MLERFELTTEVFDIEPEQAEIKIPAFNFMGVNEKPKPKKPTVHTIDSNSVIREENDAVEDGDDEIGAPEVSYHEPVSYADAPCSRSCAYRQPAAPAAESVVPAADDGEPKKRNLRRSLPFCQFRFGDVSFFISQVELDRMNAKYQEYIDSGAIPERQLCRLSSERSGEP